MCICAFQIFVCGVSHSWYSCVCNIDDVLFVIFVHICAAILSSVLFVLVVFTLVA